MHDADWERQVSIYHRMIAELKPVIFSELVTLAATRTRLGG